MKTGLTGDCQPARHTVKLQRWKFETGASNMLKNNAFWLTALLLAAPGPAAAGYDGTWHQAPYWGGEYPEGFTVTQPATITLRAGPDPDAAATIECTLTQGATYHPWNNARIQADEVEFLSFTRKAEMRITQPGTFTLLEGEMEQKEVTVKMAAGESWTYLLYLAEGMFVLDHKGTRYLTMQDLMEASEPVAQATPSTKTSDYQQWLKFTCANGNRGWAWMPELEGKDYTKPAELLSYGEASDAAE